MPEAFCESAVALSGARQKYSRNELAVVSVSAIYMLGMSLPILKRPVSGSKLCMVLHWHY